MTLIEKINTDAYQPETAKAAKEAYDHCESIMADCVETLHDQEVEEHTKRDYRILKAEAAVAAAKMKRLLKSFQL